MTSLNCRRRFLGSGEESLWTAPHIPAGRWILQSGALDKERSCLTLDLQQVTDKNNQTDGSQKRGWWAATTNWDRIMFLTLPPTRKLKDRRIMKTETAPWTLLTAAGTVLLSSTCCGVSERCSCRTKRERCSVSLSVWAVPLSRTTSNDELYRLHLFLFVSLSI